MTEQDSSQATKSAQVSAPRLTHIAPLGLHGAQGCCHLTCIDDAIRDGMSRAPLGAVKSSVSWNSLCVTCTVSWE